MSCFPCHLYLSFSSIFGAVPLHHRWPFHVVRQRLQCTQHNYTPCLTTWSRSQQPQQRAILTTFPYFCLKHIVSRTSVFTLWHSGKKITIWSKLWPVNRDPVLWPLGWMVETGSSQHCLSCHSIITPALLMKKTNIKGHAFMIIPNIYNILFYIFPTYL